jgi:hypothetical protein
MKDIEFSECVLLAALCDYLLLQCCYTVVAVVVCSSRLIGTGAGLMFTVHHWQMFVPCSTVPVFDFSMICSVLIVMWINCANFHSSQSSLVNLISSRISRRGGSFRRADGTRYLR